MLRIQCQARKLEACQSSDDDLRYALPWSGAYAAPLKTVTSSGSSHKFTTPNKPMISTDTIPLLKQPERLEARLKEIPPEPGVYFMRSSNGDILYIGKSKKFRSRVRSYFRRFSEIERSHRHDGTSGSRD